MASLHVFECKATLKGLGCLINKLVLKVAFLHVQNHDISHQPEICIFQALFKTVIFNVFALWAEGPLNLTKRVPNWGKREPDWEREAPERAKRVPKLAKKGPAQS